MTDSQWTITFRIARQRGDGERSYQDYTIKVDPDEYVLDGIERIWAFQDRGLTFRHACHHSTCGACGMLVNGYEKLTCITPIRAVSHDGGTLRIDPMRNFPVVSDLVVDMSDFYNRLEQTGYSQVAQLGEACLPYEEGCGPNQPDDRHERASYERLVDCIECGLCISACPPSRTDESYLGPAVLAAIQQGIAEGKGSQLLEMADCKEGVWRCHSAYECTAVCPSNVDPAWRIMNLRRQVIGHRIAGLFRRENKA